MNIKQAVTGMGEEGAKQLHTLLEQLTGGGALRKVMLNLLALRVIISLLLLGWGIGISIAYSRTSDPSRHDKLNFMNRVWIGDKGGVLVWLGMLWAFTLLALAFLPVISRALLAYKPT